MIDLGVNYNVPEVEMKVSVIIAKGSFLIPVMSVIFVNFLPVNKSEIENYAFSFLVGVFVECLVCIGNLIYLHNKSTKKKEQVLSFLGILPFLLLILLFFISCMYSVE